MKANKTIKLGFNGLILIDPKAGILMPVPGNQYADRGDLSVPSHVDWVGEDDEGVYLAQGYSWGEIPGVALLRPGTRNCLA